VTLIVVLIVVAAAGAAFGALGRWILPGPDPMPVWATILLGALAAIVGGAIGKPLFGTIGGLIIGICAAVGLVYLYRVWARRKHSGATPGAAGTGTPPPAMPQNAQPAAPVAPAAPPPQASAAAAAAPSAPIPAPAGEAPSRYCVECGAEFPEAARFCPSCGATRN
jgi:predicted lipid-binding transport protein (Tim44 family)